MINKYQRLLNEIDTDRKNQEHLHRDSKVLIVDGLNLFIRTFSAIPTLKNLSAYKDANFDKPAGLPISAVNTTMLSFSFAFSISPTPNAAPDWPSLE